MITQGHKNLRDSAFSLPPWAKTGENILLVKRSYKYCNILSHNPKPQYTQTLKTLELELKALNTLNLHLLALSLELEKMG